MSSNKWELISDDEQHNTFTMPCPGGWLYRHVEFGPQGIYSVKIFFVAKP